MDQLNDLLNTYSVQGLPPPPSLIQIGQPHLDENSFQVESDWRLIVENSEVRPHNHNLLRLLAVSYKFSLNIYLFDKLYKSIQYNSIQCNTIQVHRKSLQTGIQKEACWTYPNPFPKFYKFNCIGGITKCLGDVAMCVGDGVNRCERFDSALFLTPERSSAMGFKL